MEWIKKFSALVPSAGKVSFTNNELGNYATLKSGAGPTPGSKLPIGGRIFYDDGDNGATYKFYDESDVEVVYDGTIASLANATQYEVSGTPTKDRFYVFNNELVTNVQWGNYGTVFAIKTDGIGLGKSNTLKALQKPGWEANSIFQYIIDCNTNKLNGCDDWYIGSKAEQDKLRAVASTFEITWYTNKYVWASVEGYTGSKSACFWSYASLGWRESDKNTTHNICGCFAQRSF